MVHIKKAVSAFINQLTLVIVGNSTDELEFSSLIYFHYDLSFWCKMKKQNKNILSK